MVSETNGGMHSQGVIRSKFLHLAPELNPGVLYKKLEFKGHPLICLLLGKHLVVSRILSCTLQTEYKKFWAPRSLCCFVCCHIGTNS
jgi:hypothetical protein